MGSNVIIANVSFLRELTIEDFILVSDTPDASSELCFCFFPASHPNILFQSNVLGHHMQKAENLAQKSAI